MKLRDRYAPPGKFRVIGVDTFDGEDWVVGVFDTLEIAIAYMDKATSGVQMLKLHVYDDKGDHRGQRGTF